MKGADVVMAGIVQYNDWLEEEVCEVLFYSALLCSSHCSRAQISNSLLKCLQARRF